MKEARDIHPVQIIAFVLMGNHYHLMIQTPQGNLDQFMYEFNKRLALKIKINSGQINRIFGGRYKWCLIESQKYLMNCYKYIYQNPIRAGLTNRCEDYPYSTLQFVLGKSQLQVPIHDQYGFKDEFGLMWLNEKINQDEEVSLKKKLNRSVISVH